MIQKSLKYLIIALIGTVIGATTLYAHSGGTDARGCHHDRKNGGYHCH